VPRQAGRSTHTERRPSRLSSRTTSAQIQGPGKPPDQHHGQVAVR
jgi:hypothetical protein